MFKKLVVIATIALTATAIVGSAQVNADKPETIQHVPVTICHATGADGHWTNPTVDDDSILNDQHEEIGNGHANHQDGRDIIPPFTTTDGFNYPGHNWDTVGKAVFYNGCNAPKVASAAVSVDPATCDLGQKLVYGSISNATFSGTANGTTGPAAYSVTATAKNDSLFNDNTATKTFSGQLSGPLTGERCGEGVKEADITATAKCVTINEQMMIEVSLTNSGNADGEAMVNGVAVEVEAGQTVVMHYDANTKVTVIVDEQTIFEETLACNPGQGGHVTPEETETPVTTTPMELPNTSGSMTPVVIAGATIIAVLMLVVAAAVKSRFAL